MNELECMRTFVKVVEAGSFAEAARQTDTVKSVIAKRVNQLEEHLELQLLQRSTRRLTVTDAGTEYYERCVHVLAEIEQAKAAVHSTEWALSGTFRVSCNSSVIAAFLAKDLCEFRTQHPELQIELRQHDRFCDPVQEGYDVSVQPTSIPPGTLQKTELFPARRVIVATPEYLEHYGRPEQLEDLKNHCLAHNDHVEPDCTLRFEREGKPETVIIKPVVRTNTIYMLHAEIMQHKSMAMMPVFFIENELISGQLVPVLTNYAVSSAAICAYYRKSSFVPMKVRIFMNFLRNKYGNFPPWEQRLLVKHPEYASLLGRSGKPGS